MLKKNMPRVVEIEENALSFNGSIVGHPITWAKATNAVDDADLEVQEFDGAEGSDAEEFFESLVVSKSMLDIASPPSKKARKD